MIVKKFSERVLFPTKRDVLRIHLYLKFIENGIKPFENDIDIIVELYLLNGYTNSEQQARFIEICMKNKLKKSNQSVRNTLSKYVTMKVLDKPRNQICNVSEKFLPKIDCDRLVLEHIISHAE